MPWHSGKRQLAGDSCRPTSQRGRVQGRRRRRAKRASAPGRGLALVVISDGRNRAAEVGLIWGFAPRLARIRRNERMGFSEEFQKPACFQKPCQERIPLSPPFSPIPHQSPKDFATFRRQNGGGEKASVAACDASGKLARNEVACHARASLTAGRRSVARAAMRGPWLLWPVATEPDGS